MAGITKARSMGPVAQLVERCGGSAARVFRRAELPLHLAEEPERLILLKDQLRLVECAAREIGDEALPARLSTTAGFAALGAYARQVDHAPALGVAIARASSGITALLQSATRLQLHRVGGYCRWSYRVTDAVPAGRQKNEMLALGYMLDLVRRFAGPGWVPPRLEIGGARLPAKSAIEQIFRGELSAGDAAAIYFPAALVELPNPQWGATPEPGPLPPAQDCALPDVQDFVACIEQLIGLALLERRPGIDWLCRRLEMSRRVLQRRLADQGTCFETLLERVLLARACERLRAGAGVTAAAYELGYADPAHFTRAFRRWSGMTPRQWRRAQS